jgi:hypothetical protein
VPPRLRIAVSPPAVVSKLDTGLRFTDILFGFVIRELFLRLQNWSELDGYVQAQLVASTVLVLGSWLGFRLSLNRSAWEVKFFNLPLIRFVLDQVMVILYFKIAVLTPQDPHAPGAVTPSADDLVHTTIQTIFWIFVLYAVWDLLGVAMWWVNDGTGSPKYPKIGTDNEPIKGTRARRDLAAPLITLAILAIVFFLWRYVDPRTASESGSVWVFVVMSAVLLLYRLAKEIKNSYRALETPAEPVPGEKHA